MAKRPQSSLVLQRRSKGTGGQHISPRDLKFHAGAVPDCDPGGRLTGSHPSPLLDGGAAQSGHGRAGVSVTAGVLHGDSHSHSARLTDNVVVWVYSCLEHGLNEGDCWVTAKWLKRGKEGPWTTNSGRALCA